MLLLSRSYLTFYKKKSVKFHIVHFILTSQKIFCFIFQRNRFSDWLQSGGRLGLHGVWRFLLFLLQIAISKPILIFCPRPIIWRYLMIFFCQYGLIFCSDFSCSVGWIFLSVFKDLIIFLVSFSTSKCNSGNCVGIPEKHEKHCTERKRLHFCYKINSLQLKLNHRIITFKSSISKYLLQTLFKQIMMSLHGNHKNH